MKHRTRNLANVYHQFLKGTDLEGKLALLDAVACLEQRGLIERLGGDRYAETDRMRSIEPPDMFKDIILNYLREYALNKGAIK